MTIQYRVLISGKVQGVGFRAATSREAACYGSLRGYVRNLPDGRVEAVFSGDAPSVKSMVAWVRTGPPSAQVTGATTEEQPVDASLPAFGVVR